MLNQTLNRDFIVLIYEIHLLLELKVIDVCSRKITRIDPEAFNGLKNLNRLLLNKNELTHILSDTFKKLPNLLELFIYHNKLTKIDVNAFNGLVKLNLLSLSNNRIEVLVGRVFETVPNLKELYLYNNRIKRIVSDAFNGLGKLELLRLDHNEIEEIEENAFESLRILKFLYLNNNHLKRIDSKLFNGLSHLKVLKLNNNYLEEIDRQCFESLISIEILQLYENDIKVRSFYIPTTRLNNSYFDIKELNKGEFISEWGLFLLQFNELEKIDDSYIGKIFNSKYSVNRKLGRGAFGPVYLVYDITNDQKKAMKIMQRFHTTTEIELEILSNISHNNIVKYIDHFHVRIGSDQHTFLITDYCENGDLEKRIYTMTKSKKRFEESQILKWTRQIADALKYLHSLPEPIIHRDIKPSNIVLTLYYDAKLIDYGVAKIMEITHASTYAGTPAYMSPEVFMAQIMDTKYYPNTDVWSLGCVLYELVFIKRAFPNGQRGDPELPTNLSISGIFSTILPRMLEKEHKNRISSEDLLTELKKL